MEGIKKIGLLHDDGPNTLGQLLSGGHSRLSFPVDAEEVSEEQPPEQPAGVFTTWSWQPQQPERAQPSFPSAFEDEPESSSATSSDEGDLDEYAQLPDISGMSEQEAHEHVYYQYRNAKRNWRRLTGRLVRRFGRTFKKSKGRGKGYRGKSRGKGFRLTDQVQAFPVSYTHLTLPTIVGV